MEILVTTHGSLCQGLIESYEMIAGNSDGIHSLSLEKNDLGEYVTVLKETLSMLTQNHNVLILCDIVGGTPYNESLAFSLSRDESKVKIVSGVNLGMLLETGLLKNNDMKLSDLASIAYEAGKESIKLTNYLVEDQEDIF